MKDECEPRKGWYSRGCLPHFDGGEVVQMITFRLAGSLPKERIEKWKAELARLPEGEAAAEYYRRVEAYLDKGMGHRWLEDRRVAQVTQDALLHFDGERYRLYAWVVMPNHVHVMARPFLGRDLSGIVQSWKSFTAKRANKLLNRAGGFWQEEYFDRYIRNERHFRAARAYVERNPVKAGLCSRPEDWEFGSAAAHEKDAARFL